jgi:negative regulator of flagellin synthesis FlgM
MKVDPKRVGNTTTNATADAAKITRTGGAKGKRELGDIATNNDVAQVNISKKAQMANKIRELATPDMDSVNEERVAHFQKLIDEGKYKTDAKAIADKLVDEHLIS